MKTHAVKLERKEMFLDQLRDRFERSSVAILTDYRGDGSGMTVKEISELRKKLRAAGGEYRVVKNTLAAKAAKDLGIEGLETHLKGPMAIAFGYDDPAAVTKAVLDFADANKAKGVPRPHSGYMNGKVLNERDLKALADLPTLPQLQGQILGLMLSSHRNIMGVINAPGRQFAQLMEAWRAKQEEEGGSSAPASAAPAESGSSAEAPQSEEGGSSAEAPQAEEGGSSAEAPQSEEGGSSAEAPQSEDGGSAAEAPQSEEGGAPAEQSQGE
jgi:large subunit ribosomal protein L10